jgi:hypothetical protein
MELTQGIELQNTEAEKMVNKLLEEYTMVVDDPPAQNTLLLTD